MGQCREAIGHFADAVHFSGGSPGAMPWQNWAWVIAIEGDTSELRCQLATIRENYRQDSVAWTDGETQFV